MLSLIQPVDALHQAFWYLAAVSSLIFIFQSILTFIGSDFIDGLEADFDGDFNADGPFQFFSLRNMVNFMMGFGWTGFGFYKSIENKLLLIGISALVGLIFIGVFLFLIRQILKFSEDNTFKIENLIGETGEVYLTIPAQNTGRGKVLISIRGSHHELYATSNSENAIPVGSLVKVIAVHHHSLIVEKI